MVRTIVFISIAVDIFCWSIHLFQGYFALFSISIITENFIAFFAHLPIHILFSSYKLPSGLMIFNISLLEKRKTIVNIVRNLFTHLSLLYAVARCFDLRFYWHSGEGNFEFCSNDLSFCVMKRLKIFVSFFFVNSLKSVPSRNYIKEHKS